MASDRNAGDPPSDRAFARKSALQRLLSETGIPMPALASSASDDLALFTVEERRELQRGNAEQCEANR